MSVDRYWRMIRHPTLLFYVSLVCLLLFAVDPHEYRTHMPLVAALLIWPISVATYLIIEGMALAIVAIAMRYPQPFPVYIPLLNLVSFACALTISESIAAALATRPYAHDFWPSYAYLLVAVFVIETIFIRYVFPTLIAPEVLPNVDFITVGQRRLRLENILCMSSQEHYVKVVLKSETIMQRMKLPDLLDQLADCQGIQPHRSWWVSINARPVLKRNGAKPKLLLSNGTEVPVARARLQAVQDWIDTHGNW
jgi:hypothetical protein